MITLRPYRPCDLRHIQGREYERELDGTRYARQFARGPAFTLYDGEQRVAAAGVIVHWPGVGEAWMFLSPWIHQHPMVFCRIVKRELYGIMHRWSLWRVQAPLCAEMEMNIRFARMLGFKPEATMRKYGPDKKDYIMHAIVRD